MHIQFQVVQLCIQISTRINSSMYIRTSFVCSTLRVSIRIYILIGPTFNKNFQMLNRLVMCNNMVISFQDERFTSNIDLDEFCTVCQA